MSNRTKNCRIAYWILFTISLLLTIGPMLGYTIYGFIEAETAKKLVLSMTTICAIVLGALNVVFKRHIRSVIWILMIGITYALNRVTVLVIIMAICTILDEFVISPLKKSYLDKLRTNKEIDKRGF